MILQLPLNQIKPNPWQIRTQIDMLWEAEIAKCDILCKTCHDLVHKESPRPPLEGGRGKIKCLHANKL